MAGINLQKYRKQGLEVLIIDQYLLPSQSRSPFSNLWLRAAKILHDNSFILFPGFNDVNT